MGGLSQALRLLEMGQCPYPSIQCDLGGCHALIADFYDALGGHHDIFAGQRQGAWGPPSSSWLDT